MVAAKAASSNDAPAPQGKTALTGSNTQLLGSWGPVTEILRDDETGADRGKTTFSIIISEGKFTIRGSCLIDHRVYVGPVEATAAANLSDASIDILESKTSTAQRKEYDTNHSCWISTKKSKISYHLYGDTLTLDMDKTLHLNRQ